MDKGTLFNTALTYLGKSSYEAETADAEVVEKMAQHCIALAMDYATWTFAMRRVEVALDRASGRGAIPHDCLRLQKVHADAFEIIGGDLYVEGERDSVTVDYITNEFNEAVYLPDNQPTFCEAVALLLAGKMAPRLTSRFDLARELEDRARAMLSKAKHKDARQWASNDQTPNANRREVLTPVNILAE